MGTVTYKNFLDNFSSFGANLHPVFNTEPSPHEKNGEILHSLFCADFDCSWDEEEDELSAPWAGQDHLHWTALAERFEAEGISMQTAMRNQAAVLALVGITI